MNKKILFLTLLSIFSTYNAFMAEEHKEATKEEIVQILFPVIGEAIGYKIAHLTHQFSAAERLQTKKRIDGTLRAKRGIVGGAVLSAYAGAALAGIYIQFKDVQTLWKIANSKKQFFLLFSFGLISPLLTECTKTQKNVLKRMLIENLLLNLPRIFFTVSTNPNISQALYNSFANPIRAIRDIRETSLNDLKKLGQVSWRWLSKKAKNPRCWCSIL